MKSVVALGVSGAALAVLGYTYVGYPVLIGLCAKVAPTPVRRDEAYLPTVTACIPVYNAAAYVKAKIESLLALDYPPDRFEILIYSDGSTDGSDAIVAAIARENPRVRLIVADERRGKPTAVNRMKAEAKGDVLLMTDIRQPLAKGSLRALTSLLADPTVACVSGNLVLDGPSGAGAYWKYENWIRKQEAKFRGMVGVTGPIYAVRKADMADLPDGIILDDMWVPMRLRLEGRRIVFAEDAIATDDAFGDEREFGRKVRTLAGNYQLFQLLPQLLSPAANPSWFEIMSHKVARLACPWALAGLAGTSAAWLLSDKKSSLVANAALGALTAGQLAFYGLAALGPRAGKLGVLPRTFVVLNWAAVVGLWRSVRGAQKITW